ncbi:MAG: hypothetical protein ACQEUT_18915 [Bacillota bacterium]
MKRKNTINQNAGYFSILGLIHLLLLLIVLIKRRQRITWVLLFTNMGFAYLFEYLILNLFHAYRYRPLIIRNRSLDNFFGAILSQGVYVPIVALFITAFNGNWKWKAFFSLYFYFIEKLFLIKRFYIVHWWKPFFTPLFLFCYFHLSDWTYNLLNKKRKWALLTSSYLSSVVVGVSLLYATAASRKLRFGWKRHHSWKEHFKIAPLYSLFLSLVGTLVSFQNKLIYRLLFLVSCTFFDITLMKIGILKMKSRQIYANIPFHLFMIILSNFFHRAIYKWEE